jgi:glycosidase
MSWYLKPRREGKGKVFAQGINSGDLVYLLMPDRFSNGNPSNDRIPGMRDQTLNRDSIYHRHGGDLQGVINHLDYLQSMGVTALWMTPVIENDMPDRTEHGYAFTNHYKIEPRFGGEAAYKMLSDELHKRGMKLIQDAVYNHVGLYHFSVQEKPMTNWLHEWPAYTNTNWKDATIFDPHGTTRDKKQMTDGWFTPQMPDLNHDNPHMANFLIQHALWSVEEFGVDAWRIDTYMYNDMNFMNRCNQALIDEYPNIFLFGETWDHGVINQAYFVRNKINFPFKSNLAGTTDFQSLFYGITPALENPTDGLNKLYLTLSNDVVYDDPSKLVVFLDNHDLNRYFTQVKEDVAKIKMAFGWLLTTRGIPQIYYGGEVLMKGATHPRDGWVRLDFPGGWPGDKKNAFTQEGLTDSEKDVQNFVRQLATFRKNSSALRFGKLSQFIPVGSSYVYFRHDAQQTIMIILNPGGNDEQYQLADYHEIIGERTTAHDVMTGVSSSGKVSVPAKSIKILEIR